MRKSSAERRDPYGVRAWLSFTSVAIIAGAGISVLILLAAGVLIEIYAPIFSDAFRPLGF
jgi:hypothetical protein